MKLGELKVFLTVASERSFSRAAAKLYRSQPAIRQAVRRLEDQLGERLFDRTMKHGTLTPAGEVLFREGARLLRLAEQTAAAVRRQSEPERGIRARSCPPASRTSSMPAPSPWSTAKGKPFEEHGCIHPGRAGLTVPGLTIFRA